MCFDMFRLLGLEYMELQCTCFELFTPALYHADKYTSLGCPPLEILFLWLGA